MHSCGDRTYSTVSTSHLLTQVFIDDSCMLEKHELCSEKAQHSMQRFTMNALSSLQKYDGVFFFSSLSLSHITSLRQHDVL